MHLQRTISRDQNCFNDLFLVQFGVWYFFPPTLQLMMLYNRGSKIPAIRIFWPTASDYWSVDLTTCLNRFCSLQVYTVHSMLQVDSFIIACNSGYLINDLWAEVMMVTSNHFVNQVNIRGCDLNKKKSRLK